MTNKNTDCYYHGNTGCDCFKNSDIAQDMKQSQEVEVHHIIDQPEPYTITNKKYEPSEEAEVIITSVNGIRVLWGGPHKCTVERKDATGNWYQIQGVQKISITFDCKEPLPIIQIQEIAIPM